MRDGQAIGNRGIVLDRRRALVDRQRLAGERRLVDLERARAQHPRVSGDAIARAQLDDVARHHLLGVEELVRVPSRRTLAGSGTSAASAGIACPARYSWAKPMALLTTTTARTTGRPRAPQREREPPRRDQHQDQRLTELAPEQHERDSARIGAIRLGPTDFSRARPRPPTARRGR